MEAPRPAALRAWPAGCTLVLDLLWVFYVIALWCHGAHTSRRTFQQMEDVFEPVPYVAVSQNGEAWGQPPGELAHQRTVVDHRGLYGGAAVLPVQ